MNCGHSQLVYPFSPKSLLPPSPNWKGGRDSKMGGARGYLEQSRNCIFFFGTQSDFSRIHYLLNRLIRDFLRGVEFAWVLLSDGWSDGSWATEPPYAQRRWRVALTTSSGTSKLLPRGYLVKNRKQSSKWRLLKKRRTPFRRLEVHCSPTMDLAGQLPTAPPPPDVW